MPQKRQDPKETKRLDAELKAQEVRDRELAERLEKTKKDRAKGPKGRS